MRKSVVTSTREEIRQKMNSLYSDSLESNRNVLDFDRKYEFFSNNESVILKFSSNWFRPEKYNSYLLMPPGSCRQIQSVSQEEGESHRSWIQQKQEPLLKIEKPSTSNILTRDLELLATTPYQIGVDGERFRVVAATLQKCNSPFVQRTFHFTSSGIVEALEKKEGTEKIIPSKQIKTMLSQQKFLRIRRFRVIKKNDLPVEKYILPQKIRITNGDKTTFLTVRIRSKNTLGEEIQSKIETPETVTQPEKQDVVVATTSAVQTEEPNAEKSISANASEPETSSARLADEETEEVKYQEDKEEMGDAFKCNNCGKHFPTYLSCLAHVRSHQRRLPCQFCSKRFFTLKLLRDHVRMEHHHNVRISGTSEDRITTATSKFGRTRQVLNVAGLRSKYKML